MARPLTVLLTGFEPFGGSATNPSQKLVERLAGRTIAGARVHAAVLPVVGGTGAGSAWAALAAELERCRPDAAIAFGEAHTRGAVSLERLAINLRDDRIPDNAGVQLCDSPIVPGGPDALLATLPLRAMHSAVAQAGLPVELSTTAGTFLCNEAMYRLLLHARLHGWPARAGFVHLPQTPEQHATRPTHSAPMPVEGMVRAVECMMEALARATGGEAPGDSHAGPDGRASPGGHAVPR